MEVKLWEQPFIALRNTEHQDHLFTTDKHRKYHFSHLQEILDSENHPTCFLDIPVLAIGFLSRFLFNSVLCRKGIILN